ncbi:hypothetical protein AMTR_s00102p00113700 [Amborella trichopoda]|uniref:UDP-glycosyltransferase n=1 Tax=Amborella trichopoda TaxID=13333 RepID=W1NY25_AMBTC|nr:hypothetical protein AMTR_s00102p00113700 [Amborella trichopoda]
MAASHLQASGEEVEDVVLVPFPAQGHLIPFLALAHLLAHRTSYAIILVGTPGNAQKMRSMLATATITVAELPFPALTTDCRLAVESLQPALKRLLSESPRSLCLIGDAFCGWTLSVAEELGIFHASFSTSGEFGTSVVACLWLQMPHKNTDSDEFELPDLVGLKLSRSHLPPNILAADGMDLWSEFMRRNFLPSLHSGGLLCNTVAELEP